MQSYWNSNGKHQADCDALLAEMSAQKMDREKFRLSENQDWAIFNGMVGMYYGWYNDGDGPAGAIDNNRVHGFTSLEDFRDLCAEMRLPHSVLLFLDSRTTYPQELESAMDAVISFAAVRRLRKNTVAPRAPGPLSIQPVARKRRNTRRIKL